ncbi:MAG: DUF3575 domain-containing protein [Bacteroides sp.]|nr:DUF3575 domain-containing protein [Bacteroides sp.]
MLLNGTFANWGWKDNTRRYKIRQLSPELRRYLGKEQRAFVGIMYHLGDFNYHLGETGKTGSYQGGGITAGYQQSLLPRLQLELHGAVGYTRARYDQYTRIDGVNVLQNKNGRLTKNYWGVNQLGVLLIWKPFLMRNEK